MKELKVFFWGIFKDKEMIERRIGILPNDFLDATFIAQDGTIKLTLKGKLAIWRDFPSRSLLSNFRKASFSRERLLCSL